MALVALVVVVLATFVNFIVSHLHLVESPEATRIAFFLFHKLSSLILSSELLPFLLHLMEIFCPQRPEFSIPQVWHTLFIFSGCGPLLFIWLLFIVPFSPDSILASQIAFHWSANLKFLPCPPLSIVSLISLEKYVFIHLDVYFENLSFSVEHCLGHNLVENYFKLTVGYDWNSSFHDFPKNCKEMTSSFSQFH